MAAIGYIINKIFAKVDSRHVRKTSKMEYNSSQVFSHFRPVSSNDTNGGERERDAARGSLMSQHFVHCVLFGAELIRLGEKHVPL